MRKIYIFIWLLIMPVFALKAQNLVQNSSFDNWDDANKPTSWTTAENCSQEATIKQSDPYSCKHVGGTSKLAQTISVNPGTLYEISVSYYVESGDGTDCRLWSYWQDNGDNIFDADADILRTSYFPGEAAWKTYTTTVTAPDTATDLYLEVRTYSDAIVYWDDISVTETTDTDPPVWASDYPAAMNIMETSFDIAAKLDESSTVYYVVLNSGETAPTVAEVIAGTGSGGSDTVSSGSFTAGIDETMETVSNLAKDVTYDVYLVAEDDEDTPNVQENTVNFSVTPTTPPIVIVNETFDNDLGTFTAVNIEGDQTWVQDDFSDTTFAKISGYSGGAQLNEDWLISGPVDLDVSTDNILSFISALNFSGPPLELYISSDFPGIYDSISVVDALWTDLTAEAAWSEGDYDWIESGKIDLSGYSDTVYFAFKYTSNPDDGAATWEITEFMITGYLKPEADATLSDLMVDGETITGFDPAKTNYTVELPADATVPVVTVTTNYENATAVVTDATDLAGDEASRTTTVEVTAQNGKTTQTYRILFNPVIEVTTLAEFRAGDTDRTYLITGELLVTYTNSFRNKKYVQDTTAGIEIDDPSGVITTTYTIGDKIANLKAELGFFNDMAQLIPVEDPGAAVSSGNEVIADTVTIEDFNANLSDYEGKYIMLEGVRFNDAGGTFEGGSNYDLSDGVNTAVLRTNFYDADYIGITIPTVADVSGVVISYRGTPQVAPRFASDIEEYSSDATLSDLLVNGTSITGFDAATMDYDVTLEVGTSEIPDITYTTADENAMVSITDATDLFGSEAERTATVEVTSEDETTTMTYTITFTVDNTGLISSDSDIITVYPVPADNYLIIKGLNNNEAINIIDITGATVKNVKVNHSEIRINVSNFDEGIYFIRTSRGYKKFIKK